MAEDQQQHLTIRTKDQVKVVEFSDRKILEELSIAEIGDELQKLVEAEPKIKLLLNFHSVEHLSSAALGMLITLNTRVDAAGGSLKLCDIRPQIMEVFKITRLNKLFDIHGTADGALNAF